VEIGKIIVKTVDGKERCKIVFTRSYRLAYIEIIGIFGKPCQTVNYISVKRTVFIGKCMGITTVVEPCTKNNVFGIGSIGRLKIKVADINDYLIFGESLRRFP